MPVVRLENVFRQAQLSPIVRNAHRINQGLMPLVDGETDFTFRQFMNEEETVRYVSFDTYARMFRTLSWQRCTGPFSPCIAFPAGIKKT